MGRLNGCQTHEMQTVQPHGRVPRPLRFSRKQAPSLEGQKVYSTNGQISLFLGDIDQMSGPRQWSRPRSGALESTSTQDDHWEIEQKNQGLRSSVKVKKGFGGVCFAAAAPSRRCEDGSRQSSGPRAAPVPCVGTLCCHSQKKCRSARNLFDGDEKKLDSTAC
jgi:hypothetical protein